MSSPPPPIAPVDGIPASVPGDINVALADAGVLPDLLFGTNSMAAAWVCDVAWTLNTTFDTPSAFAPASVALLRFEGADFNVTVTLNGIPLGMHTGSFEPFELDATAAMHPPHGPPNALAVWFAPAPGGMRHALFTEDAFMGGARTTYSAGAVQRESLTRWKLAIGNGGGVDFGTPAWPLGLWNNVSLRVHLPGAAMRLDSDTLVVLPAVSAPYDHATLRLRVSVQASRSVHEAMDARVVWRVVCVTNASAPNASGVSVVGNAGGLVQANVTLQNPSLWWPSQYGEQHLYSLKAELWANAELVDVRDVRFGVRELAFLDNDLDKGTSWLYNDYGVEEPCDDDLHHWCGGTNVAFPARNSSDPGRGGLPDHVRQWTMAINGRKVFGRGANWLPVDSWPGRYDDRVRAAVMMAAEANIVFLRVWGGGLVEKQVFFDACDDAGILLLIEMPKMAPRSDVTRGGVLEGEAADTSAAIMQALNHPCVTQYGLANEQYTNASWDHVQRQFERIVASLDGTRPARVANPEPAAQRHGPYWFRFADSPSYDVHNHGCSDVAPAGSCRPGSTAQHDTGPADPFEWAEVGTVLTTCTEHRCCLLVL
jgi:beta-mannosidase